MNKITEALSKVFTENQIQALKDAWRYGSWGDTQVQFYTEDGEFAESWALAACTNDIHKGGHFSGRQISGIMSSISKKIDESNTDLIRSISDWWGDGTGDMVFFHIQGFGYEDSSKFWDALTEWSKSND